MTHKNNHRSIIRHIVLFSAKNIADLPAIEAGLAILGHTGETLHFEVRRNHKWDPLSTDADLVVYAEFTDNAALQRYRCHPLYEESIRIVRPMRNLRIVADITSGETE